MELTAVTVVTIIRTRCNYPSGTGELNRATFGINIWCIEPYLCTSVSFWKHCLLKERSNFIL